MIDLNDYERGDTLAVRVNALAAENARTYRDGPDGVETEMVLPSRLDVPDVSWMGTNLPYAEDQFVTLDQLSDGIGSFLQAAECKQRDAGQIPDCRCGLRRAGGRRYFDQVRWRRAG